MRCLHLLYGEDAGFVLSSELVLLGTLGVIGATVGLSAAARSVNEELTELAFAFRSLDQSYCVEGTHSCSAWTAGSQFIQRDKEESIADLCAAIERDEEAAERKLRDAERRLDELQLQKEREQDKKAEKSGDSKKGDGKPSETEKPRKKKKADRKPKAEA